MICLFAKHFSHILLCIEPNSCLIYEQDLVKSTRPVTATLVHRHRKQILRFESLLEIQMVAGTWERPSLYKISKDLVI